MRGRENDDIVDTSADSNWSFDIVFGSFDMSHG
jgi:hypothetical protein